jgi:hypothetical protein
MNALSSAAPPASIRARLAAAFIVICLAIGTFRMLRALNAAPVTAPQPAAVVNTPAVRAAAPVPVPPKPTPPPAPLTPDPWGEVDISNQLQSYLRTKPPLLDPEWKLSAKAVDALQLSPEEITKVQNVLDTTRQQMRAEAQRRLVPEPRLSKGDIHAFRMKAYPREGRAMRGAMCEKVAQQIGAKRATLFSAAFSGGMFAGDFGRHDLELKVKPAAPAEPGAAAGFEVEYKARAYENGQLKKLAKLPLEDLERELGLKLAITAE